MGNLLNKLKQMEILEEGKLGAFHGKCMKAAYHKLKARKLTKSKKAWKVAWLGWAHLAGRRNRVRGLIKLSKWYKKTKNAKKRAYLKAWGKSLWMRMNKKQKAFMRKWWKKHGMKHEEDFDFDDDMDMDDFEDDDMSFDDLFDDEFYDEDMDDDLLV